MIPEPQKTYVLELLAALGTAADDFVVAGAQAMKFSVEKVRGTKDVDFILNVIALRKDPQGLSGGGEADETASKLPVTRICGMFKRASNLGITSTRKAEASRN